MCWFYTISYTLCFLQELRFLSFIVIYYKLHVFVLVSMNRNHLTCYNHRYHIVTSNFSVFSGANTVMLYWLMYYVHCVITVTGINLFVTVTVI